MYHNDCLKLLKHVMYNIFAICVIVPAVTGANMKNNYQAWDIDKTEFLDTWQDKQKLLFFVNYAVLAPSGHNTQPWEFKFENDSILLQHNSHRDLPFSGQLAAEPYVSLGSCTETLRHAALGFGYELNIDYLFTKKAVALISLGSKTKQQPEILEAITHRSSNRTKFNTQPTPQKILDFCTTHNLTLASVDIVTEPEEFKFLAEQTAIATKKIMHDKEFRNELSKWVRNNLTKKYDGMPGFAQEMPTPPSLIARHIVKNIDISNAQAKVDAKRVLKSGTLLLISAHTLTPQAYFEVGRLYAQICIRADIKGYATSGVGAAVIDPSTKRAITTRLKLKYPPSALIRLGTTPKQVKHTPRWPAQNVTS